MSMKHDRTTDPDFDRWCRNWLEAYGSATTLQQVVSLSAKLVSDQKRDNRSHRSFRQIHARKFNSLEEHTRWQR